MIHMRAYRKGRPIFLRFTSRKCAPPLSPITEARRCPTHSLIKLHIHPIPIPSILTSDPFKPTEIPPPRLPPTYPLHSSPLPSTLHPPFFLAPQTPFLPLPTHSLVSHPSHLRTCTKASQNTQTRPQPTIPHTDVTRRKRISCHHTRYLSWPGQLP